MSMVRFVLPVAVLSRDGQGGENETVSGVVPPRNQRLTIVDLVRTHAFEKHPTDCSDFVSMR